MTDRLSGLFCWKKVNLSRLESFGFQRAEDLYVYQKDLAGCGLRMTVRVSPAGEVSAQVTDPISQAPYTLHLANGAVGSFVGNVRTQYEETLRDIAAQCFEPDVFVCPQTKALIAYVRATYGDEPEFLWQKFPDNAIWRRKDNQKWYGAVLTVSRRKLGLPSDETAEILDLRLDPAELARTVDGQTYFPGWHMNKKTWYTIVLDGSVALEELCRRIDISYAIARNR